MNEQSNSASVTPALSVVMPVRNGEAYLAAAIRSILSQTFADYEFIIINDGSSDRTAEILSASVAVDGRIRVLETSGDGIVTALNLGIGAARSPLIARMDADDIALPERFAVQIQALRNMPELVAIGSEATVMNAGGKEIGHMKVPADAESAMAALMRHNSFLHPTMMLRRDAILAVGLFRPACIYAEDYDLWLRLSERGKMANVAQALIRLRTHAMQTSKVRRLTQRAATALARQLALRRKKGEGEGIDMSQALHTALVIFLQQRAAAGGEVARSEGKDIEIILREVHTEVDSALAKKIIRMLRPAHSRKDSLILRMRLALTAGRPRRKI